MKKYWLTLIIALSATIFMMYQNGAFAAKPKEAKTPAVTAEAKVEESPTEGASAGITAQLDKTSLNNGGKITVTGKAPEGKPVYIEVWADKKVRASRFDSEVDPDTGKRPYIFYLTEEMPAYYKLFVPKDFKDALVEEQKKGRKWSVSAVLRNTGATAVFNAPASAKIDRYQTSLFASVVGSRGELLSPMGASENKRRAMQLVKARFRDLPKVFSADVDIQEDGTFKAEINIREGLAPGNYYVVAAVDKDIKTQPLTFTNNISFPIVFMDNAGTSINIFFPFLLTLAVTTFGVLMGAGGGFILNPLLVSLWPFPHTVVAGTVMPTVLFSQGSGIYNYSRIKFINFKLGIVIGLAMVIGGFIGPKLTELITLDQYKFIFGWILIILAALMLWQTTPGYLEKNKKEQAILKEYQKRAKEAAEKKKSS